MSDDKDLTAYLWPIVREMVKTAIENKQNLIVEGCYIPFDWQKDFDANYLESIKYYCLVMSDKYIKNHFAYIKNYANAIENRVIQCVPLDEKSSASNHRNGDTISIEICHPDESGKFTDATYNSVVELVAWLAESCNLSIDHVIRHYEVTGKICPKYYVENDDAWAQLRADVQARMGE